MRVRFCHTAACLVILGFAALGLLLCHNRQGLNVGTAPDTAAGRRFRALVWVEDGLEGELPTLFCSFSTAPFARRATFIDVRAQPSYGPSRTYVFCLPDKYVWTDMLPYPIASETTPSVRYQYESFVPNPTTLFSGVGDGPTVLGILRLAEGRATPQGRSRFDPMEDRASLAVDEEGGVLLSWPGISTAKLYSVSLYSCDQDGREMTLPIFTCTSKDPNLSVSQACITEAVMHCSNILGPGFGWLGRDINARGQSVAGSCRLRAVIRGVGPDGSVMSRARSDCMAYEVKIPVGSNE